MKRTALVVLLFIWPAIVSPADLSGDTLVKSIGLVKPVMTRPPDFNLRDTNANLVSMSGYRGSMVLLNFWATWCGPCRDEMPSMENLSRRFGARG